MQNLKETFQKVKSGPMPFSLFRLNEMLDYKMSNVGCVISEKIYFERLEVLPPFELKNNSFSEGFVVSECITYAEKGSIYEHCVIDDKKHYCIIGYLHKV